MNYRVCASVRGSIGNRRGRTWLMFISSPSKALSSLISEMGVLRASEKVKWRSKTGAPNVKVSISSEPAA